MEILLNGRPIEYELEGEGTVGDIVKALDEWLAKTGKVLLTLRVDGTDVAIRDPSPALARGLAGVARVEAEGQDARVLAIETLDEGKAYLQRLGRLIPGLAESVPRSGPLGDDIRERYVQLLEGSSFLESVFRSAARLFDQTLSEVKIPARGGSEGAEVSLEILLLRLGDFRDHGRRGLDEGRGDVLAGLLGPPLAALLEDLSLGTDRLLARIETSGESMGEDREELLASARAILPNLEAVGERLERVATQIQTGKTSDGLSSLAEIAGLIEEVFRLIQRLERSLGLTPEEIPMGTGTLASSGQSVAMVLQELLTAFEKEDRVLIADLAEYEVTPIANQLCETLRFLVEKASQPVK